MDYSHPTVASDSTNWRIVTWSKTFCRKLAQLSRRCRVSHARKLEKSSLRTRIYLIVWKNVEKRQKTSSQKPRSIKTGFIDFYPHGNNNQAQQLFVSLFILIYSYLYPRIQCSEHISTTILRKACSQKPLLSQDTLLSKCRPWCPINLIWQLLTSLYGKETNRNQGGFKERLYSTSLVLTGGLPRQSDL